MKLKNVFSIVALTLVVIVGCKEANDPGIRPTVTSTDPLNSMTRVSTTTAVGVTFSEAMNQATITATTFMLKHGSTAIPGSVTYAGKQATFISTSPLEASKIYTGTISTGAEDISGDALLTDYIFTFTTNYAPDVTKPTIYNTDPLNNSTSVVRNKVIAITFNEDMDPLTINDSTFTIMQGAIPVSGLIYYAGRKAMFESAALMPGLTYTATINMGATDLAGNALEANRVWSFTTGGTITTLPVVDLGASVNYVVLAKTAITHTFTSTSTITGDLGLSPGPTSYVTGFFLNKATGYATTSQITGKVYAADMADPTPNNLTEAVSNMTAAYDDAAGRPSPDFSELGLGNIGGRILPPGLYKWTSTVTIPTTITISGGANDVWIFQIAGDLTMSSAVNITLNGGAQAKNIFWQVAGQATLGTTSHFEGILLSMTGITFQTGASITGRALAQTAVVLDRNAITKPQ